MALCRMREIVPAWLPEQPISVLLTSVPTAQPAAENHTGLLQAAWGTCQAWRGAVWPCRGVILYFVCLFVVGGGTLGY